MATETRSDVGISTGEIKWLSAVLAGIIGTLAFGLLYQAIGRTAVISMAFPAMYGIQGPALAAGWAIHLFHGAVLGVVYAGAVSVSPLSTYANRIVPAIGLGVVYGILTTIVLAGLILPVWLGAVGFPGAPPLPNVTLPSLAGHVIYGVLLAVLYPIFGARL